MVDKSAEQEKFQELAEQIKASHQQYETVNAFVEDFIARAYCYPLGQERVWCPEWYAHPAALARLTALWIAYETVRIKTPHQLVTWWISQADPTMRVLFDPKGVFKGCSIEMGHKTERPYGGRLPTLPTPPLNPTIGEYGGS